MLFLAISGSLRRQSTNRALLHAMAAVAPADVRIRLSSRLDALPIFNPDLEENTPDAVMRFAAEVGEADGLILSCPEYAHGIPGGLKNALDWLVSRNEIPFKPVMIVRASSRNAISHQALREVLATMSVDLMAEDGVEIHLVGKTQDAIDAILDDRRADLRTAVENFRDFVMRARL